MTELEETARFLRRFFNLPKRTPWWKRPLLCKFGLHEFDTIEPHEGELIGYCHGCNYVEQLRREPWKTD